MIRQLFVGVIVSLAGVTQGGEWKSFSPKDGSFSVLMPGLPMEDKQDVKTVSGDVVVTMYLLEVKNEGSLIVSSSEFPEAALQAGTDEKRLDGARDGAVMSAKGKLRSEKKIMLDGRPGRELTIDSEKSGTVRTRIFAADKRLYQTLIAGSKTFVSGKEAEMFLDSFKVLK